MFGTGLEGGNAMECNHTLICDVAILANGSVLLVRYEDMEAYDGEAGWFLPDDVIQDFEHPTKAAARIASEQVGIDLGETGLQHIESFRGNDGSWHMAFHHLSELSSTPSIEPKPGIADAQWFPVDDLPPRSEVAHRGWAITVLKKMNLPVAR
jgi:ADP-ribose pyrophosphatase YjhB (NUDIX family)